MMIGDVRQYYWIKRIGEVRIMSWNIPWVDSVLYQLTTFNPWYFIYRVSVRWDLSRLYVETRFRLVFKLSWCCFLQGKLELSRVSKSGLIVCPLSGVFQDTTEDLVTVMGSFGVLHQTDSSTWSRIHSRLQRVCMFSHCYPCDTLVLIGRNRNHQPL